MGKFSVEQTLRRAKLHAQKGEWAKARELYAIVLEKFPQNKKAKVALLDIARNAKPKVGAVLPSQTANQLVTMLNQGQVKRVIEETQRLCRVFPDSHVLWNILGVAFHKAGNLASAVQSFEKSCEVNPKFAEAFNNLGLSLAAIGREKEAIGKFRRAIEIKPAYVEALNNLGSLYFKIGKLSASVECFERVAKLGTSNVEAINDHGQVLTRQGKLEGAFTRFEAALELNPNHPGILNNLAKAYEIQSKTDLAILSYLRAIKADPNFEQSYFNLAKLPSGLLSRDVVEIIRNFRPSSDPDCLKAESQFFRGHVLRHMGMFTEGFDFICSANKSKMDEEKIKLWRKRIASLEEKIDMWRPNSNANEGELKPKLLFILGPSRSGKSTVERIISGSKSVLCANEGWRHNLDSPIHTGATSGNSEGSKLPSNVAIEDIIYFAEEDIKAQNADVVVCTHPGVIYDATFIHDSFDSAYFVFVNRDAIDTASEVFAKVYGTANEHSYDAQSSLDYVKWYKRVSDVLNTKMGERAISVNFESVLRNPQDTVSKIEKLLGKRLYSESQTYEKNENRPAPHAAHFKELLEKTGDGDT